MIVCLVGLHIVIMLKQKHAEPSCNRGQAPEGKLIGVPLWPHQAILMGQLFLLLTGGLMLLAGFMGC